jgi:hypothetical protein
MENENSHSGDQADLTGLPLLHSWRSVYILVLSVFALIVVVLTLFTRTFS